MGKDIIEKTHPSFFPSDVILKDHYSSPRYIFVSIWSALLTKQIQFAWPSEISVFNFDCVWAERRTGPSVWAPESLLFSADSKKVAHFPSLWQVFHLWKWNILCAQKRRNRKRDICDQKTWHLILHLFWSHSVYFSVSKRGFCDLSFWQKRRREKDHQANPKNTSWQWVSTHQAFSCSHC